MTREVSRPRASRRFEVLSTQGVKTLLSDGEALLALIGEFAENLFITGGHGQGVQLGERLPERFDELLKVVGGSLVILALDVRMYFEKIGSTGNRAQIASPRLMHSRLAGAAVARAASVSVADAPEPQMFKP